MSGFFRWTERQYSGMADVLKRSFSAVLSFMPFLQNPERSESDEARRMGTLSAMRLVLSDDDGTPVEKKLSVLRRLLDGERPPEEVEALIQELRTVTPLGVEEIAAFIGSFNEEERRKLMRFLLSLAAAAETSDKKVDELRQIFVTAGEDAELFLNFREDTLRIEERRRRIIGSGAGIAVALVVVLVFIGAAVFLRSVIFGLILAYILLPLEKYFERRERKKSGIVYYLFRIVSLPILPLQKLSRRITRRNSSDTGDPREQERRQERRIITKAVAQTALTALIIVCVLMGLVTRFTARYVGGFRARNQKTAVTATAAPAATDREKAPAASGDGVEKLSAVEEYFSQLVEKSDEKLKHFRARLESTPIIRFVLNQVIKSLKDKNFRKELLTVVLKHSGGVVAFTADMLGSVAVLIVDLLLTVFFALLFLMKLAEFCRDDDSSGRKSEYLVRTVFNGNWLPDTNKVTLGEASRILSGITERLRIWVRGYMMLVCIDATVYTTLFFFLRVPYFPVLGILAGCGILLPYVGPILSASVTLLVTILAGHCTGLQLMGIIVAYLIYNGIIEQFILYPAVIGDSLGLTTLETIVVVLLGAVIAGIPGMLLALPTASVLKYLIPQILQYLRLRKAAREESAGEGELTTVSRNVRGH